MTPRLGPRPGPSGPTPAGFRRCPQPRAGRLRRVVVAGRLDTVPVAGNLPVRLEGDAGSGALVGRGTADMKGGVAVQLRVAATLPSPTRDVTFVFYDHEEVDAASNGLGR